MTKGFKKKLSKRMPAKRRYKIEKKVREHNKKLKKVSKKKEKMKSKPKDPGVPNSLPFKEQVIREAQQRKAEELERKKLLREEMQRRQKGSKDKALNKKRGISDVNNLEQLAAKSVAQNDSVAENEELSVDKSSSSNVSNTRAYFKEFQKVIDQADVIIEVLDARDPLGTRCKEVEKAIIAAGPSKKLVLLLNKVDLVPRDNMNQWLKYLKNEFPTVAFKASTQSQKDNLGRSSKNIETANEAILSSSQCLGANELMKLLGNYTRSEDVRMSIVVGIVGYPNVGKSSIINSLKRSRVCNVGSMPGVTKAKQEIILDKHVRLLDCPGIVFAKNLDANGDKGAALLALRNAVKIEQLQDPITPVEAIIERVKKQDLMLLYNIPDFSSVGEFLALLAKKCGKLKKGGIPNTNAAAKKVLNDWNSGKIKYFTMPPEKYSNFSMDVEMDNEAVDDEKME
ncbi:guanine nucleotide-binding protein-like 3 [Leptotrombidium deliense]|uniref:Guanine nucleotide-binding protein-like 3 homolog n=1 Tax=Leptotrombidium deliense TaxID=299467 RepID=A0A443SM78_9ACAR|nr:guanine nucleotide-binding protein-like 3 [Leptotrombidium deliense]